MDIQSVLRGRGYARVIDLSGAEGEHRHFEGTGALVLDRINGVAYVALSERADRALAEHWVDELGYKVAFSKFGQEYKGLGEHKMAPILMRSRAVSN